MVVRIAEIDWIESDHDYVLLHVGEKSWILRETIANIEMRLALSGVAARAEPRERAME